MVGVGPSDVYYHGLTGSVHAKPAIAREPVNANAYYRFTYTVIMIKRKQSENTSVLQNLIGRCRKRIMVIIRKPP